MQPIQDTLADIIQVGLVTTDVDGHPLTRMSNACQFCQLMASSPSGRQACIASWRRLGQLPEREPHFLTCHAGLAYARARIEVSVSSVSSLVAGQFYASPPDPQELAQRTEYLAAAHHLSQEQLAAAAARLPVLDQRAQSRVGEWLSKIARAFEEIGRERQAFMNRLSRIAALSNLETYRSRPPLQ